MLYELTEGRYRPGTDYFLDSKFYLPQAGHGYDPHDQDATLVKTMKMNEFFDVMRHNDAWILNHESFESTVAEHFQATLEEIQQSIDTMEDYEGNVGYPHHLKRRMMFFRRLEERKQRVFYNGENPETVDRELGLEFYDGRVPNVKRDPKYLARSLREDREAEEDE